MQSSSIRTNFPTPARIRPSTAYDPTPPMPNTATLDSCSRFNPSFPISSSVLEKACSISYLLFFQQTIEKIRKCPIRMIRELDGGLGMQIHLPGDHVWNVETPPFHLFKRRDIVVNDFQQRPHMILRIPQEAQHQLGMAVAGTPAQPVNSGVQVTGAHDECLDGICERELLVVVRVNSKNFAATTCGAKISGYIASCDFAVKTSKTVYQVNDIHIGIREDPDGFVQFMFIDGGGRHQVAVS